MQTENKVAADRRRKYRALRSKVKRYADKVRFGVHVGDTVLVSRGIGTVRYIGPIHFKNYKKDWLGVELKEPNGENDGSLRGRRYFTCPPKFGIFVKKSKQKAPPKDHRKQDLLEKMRRLAEAATKSEDFTGVQLPLMDENLEVPTRSVSTTRTQSYESERQIEINYLSIQEPPSPSASLVSFPSVISVSTFSRCSGSDEANTSDVSRPIENSEELEIYPDFNEGSPPSSANPAHETYVLLRHGKEMKDTEQDSLL